ncbi:transcription antitermination factor NusB [Clostridium niameyense]|uniref:Transcription antitermination protein NusB n=1 Tax=Clostridium niameyense TaxID=1622073 RepID=A0A6M0R7Y8_9CLOT|nr:transcription antitermination factor NusB [Clostridium niameyense]NEZ46304.1 transcription antitermination factor NusB [Clostridium niameyense]
MNRTKSREVAMKLLFQVTINGEKYEDVVDNSKEILDEKENHLDMDYIVRILKGVEEHREELDKEIEKFLLKWKLSRLSKIDLTILRLATYEVLYEEEIPNKVAVNEAIEIAKKYSEEKSASFINGVLGNMIKR